MWTWNHARISAEDRVFRRILRHPDFLLAPDAVTGEPRVGPAALQYDEASGVSVHLESMLESADVTAGQLCNWDTHAIASLTVSDVRRLPVPDSAGVVHDPDPADAVLGHAHACIRVPVEDAKAARRAWKLVRSAIAPLMRLTTTQPESLTRL